MRVPIFQNKLRQIGLFAISLAGRFYAEQRKRNKLPEFNLADQIIKTTIRRKGYKMIHDNQEIQYQSKNIFGVFMGVLVGGLAGAVTMLLLAPQSGKETRIQLQRKGNELRGQTSKMIGDAVEQVRLSANKIAVGGQMKAGELLQQGQNLVVEQLDHVSEAAQAGKKAIKGSENR